MLKANELVLKDATKSKIPNSSLFQSAPRTRSCATNATALSIHSSGSYTIDHVRHFSQQEFCIKKHYVLGRGAFGKCFVGTLGPLEICIKVIKKAPVYDASFLRETSILSKCCHPNLPFLYGICNDGKHNMIILSLHTINTQSYTIHSILCETKKCIKLDISTVQWKKILFGIISGILYLHDKAIQILHNDIKEDNIIMEYDTKEFTPILIDFGKACSINNAKNYSLSSAAKEEYKQKHPQIAPDLRDGHCYQSPSTDIYSFGRVMLTINQHKLSLPALTSMSECCLKYNSAERPTTKSMYTFLSNL